MNTIKLLIISLGLCGFVLESKAQDLVLGSTLKRVKLAKAKELSDSLKAEAGILPIEKSVPQVPQTPQAPQAPELPRKTALAEPLATPENPILTGIFGVNDELRAVINFKGEVVSLSNDYRPKGLGTWAYGYVFPEGVLLTIAPLNVLGFKNITPMLQGRLSNKPVCQLLNLSDKQCLLLVPVSLPQRDTLAGRAGAFQDQVRSLISQPVPPINYTGPNGQVASNGVPPFPPAPTPSSSAASQADSRESAPARTGRLPR